MKLEEIHNIELFKKLELLEPTYYYARVGDPKETTKYSDDLFRRINLLLAKYNIKFCAMTYHKKRTEDRIDLYRTYTVFISKCTKKQVEDWITIYKDKGKI